MKTLYKYVDFNETFEYAKPNEPAVKYIKANHNRGYWIQESTGKRVYRNFKKSDVVEANIPDNSFTSYMKVGG